GRYHRDVVGFVFQHHYLLPHLPARVNVEIPLIGAGLGPADRRARATALLGEVGLEHRIDSLAAHLSGGERQRVAVARALANNPRLPPAAAPSGALDAEGWGGVLDLLEAAGAGGGMTLMGVSYDGAIAAGAARRLQLRDGRLVGAASRI